MCNPASGCVILIKPEFCFNFAKLMHRFMMDAQSGHIATRFPKVFVIALYSIKSAAGFLGARHRTQ